MVEVGSFKQRGGDWSFAFMVVACLQVLALPEITHISCGNTHVAALSADGRLYSWGVALRGPPLSSKLTGLPEVLEESKVYLSLQRNPALKA